MINKIIVTYVDGHCVEFSNVVSYNDCDGYLAIVCRWGFPNYITKNTTKINLNNIIGYTVCEKEVEEETNNG